MTGRSLVLRPSAKINLVLRVGPRRPDGFHDLRSLFQSIALSDRLTLTARRGPLTLDVGSAAVPADDGNLVWRAAIRMWRALGRSGDPHGVAVELRKQIPVAAGLGGGSADAAAALVGLHRMWKGRLMRSDLLRLAADLGSDVPFFLVGGTAWGFGRGEELYPAADVPRLCVIVLSPSTGVVTADAYRWLDEDRVQGARGRSRVRSASCDVGWPAGPLALKNDLEAPVCGRMPGVAEALQALEGAGAGAAAMSGSGSACFGVFTPARVDRAARRLRRAGWQVVATRTISRRDSLRRIGLI